MHSCSITELYSCTIEYKYIACSRCLPLQYSFSWTAAFDPVPFSLPPLTRQEVCNNVIYNGQRKRSIILVVEVVVVVVVVLMLLVLSDAAAMVGTAVGG